MTALRLRFNSAYLFARARLQNNWRELLMWFRWSMAYAFWCLITALRFWAFAALVIHFKMAPGAGHEQFASIVASWAREVDPLWWLALLLIFPCESWPRVADFADVEVTNVAAPTRAAQIAL